jgi:fused signal recognition particle receptor
VSGGTKRTGFWASVIDSLGRLGDDRPEAARPAAGLEVRTAQPAPAPPPPGPADLAGAPSPVPSFELPPAATVPSANVDRPDGGTSDRVEPPSATPLAARPDEAPAGAIDRPDAGAVPEPRSWWDRLASGLRRTSSQLGDGVAAIFTKRKLDEATLEELEDLLIAADLGQATAARVAGALRSGRFDKEIGAEGVREVLADEVEKTLAPLARPFAVDPSLKPHVVLVVGVNGTGKTTTIGKLAALLSAQGRKVVLAAGDTFRAAAIEQLKIWGERTGAAVVAKGPGADAAALSYEAFEQARAEGADVLVIDTAGRLQNKTELMAELEKIVRVLKKLDPAAPHSVLQTLDATTGQNAIGQVETFGKVAGVTGLVMTKLDGTARGGILVAVAERFRLPVHFIGVGEGIEDLEAFEAREFARAIAGLS